MKSHRQHRAQCSVRSVATVVAMAWSVCEWGGHSCAVQCALGANSEHGPHTETDRRWTRRSVHQSQVGLGCVRVGITRQSFHSVQSRSLETSIVAPTETAR